MLAIPSLFALFGSLSIWIGGALILFVVGNTIVAPIVRDYWEELHPLSPSSAGLYDPQWASESAWYQNSTPTQQKVIDKIVSDNG